MLFSSNNFRVSTTDGVRGKPDTNLSTSNHANDHQKGDIRSKQLNTIFFFKIVYPFISIQLAVKSYVEMASMDS